MEKPLLSHSSPSGSLAKFLMITLDRTGLEDPVLGTEIGRNLPTGITIT
jgi:hypothetical protein